MPPKANPEADPDTALTTFDPTTAIELPGGGWVIKADFSPCRECLEDGLTTTIFEVIRETREVKVDGEKARVVSTSCQCPRYYEHARRERPRNAVRLGQIDMLTGIMTLEDEDR